MRIAVVLAAAAVVASPRSAVAQARLESVRWLAACWEAVRPTSRVVERWQVSGAELKGDSRSTVIATGRESEGERLRIYAIGDTLVYDAHPSGQARTEFKAVGTKGDSVVFLNPAHDFPQRISYHKRGADSLVARVEGDRAGRRQPLVFSYRRIDCGTVTDSPSDAVEAVLRNNYADLAAMLDVSNAGLNNWFLKYGGADITYVWWATAGYRPPVVAKDQMDRVAAQQAQATPASAQWTDRVNTATVDRALVRGDTAEVLATMTMSYKFVDGTGRYGPANERRLRRVEHRRLDRWIKRDGKWVLVNAAFVGEEMSIDGKAVTRNGSTLP
jgi:hypothetical protein